MKEKKKVNLPEQIVITLIGLFIPLVWIYPFYKIQKVTRFFLIYLGVFGSLMGLMLLSTILPEEIGTILIGIGAFGYIVGGFIAIPFIIKWSRVWNKSIDADNP